MDSRAIACFDRVFHDALRSVGPGTHDPVDAFTECQVRAGIDRFAAAEMAAKRWEESVFELQRAAARLRRAVIDGWLITTAEVGQDDKHAPDLAGSTAIKLLVPGALADRAELAANHARLDVEIKSAESPPKSDDDEAMMATRTMMARTSLAILNGSRLRRSIRHLQSAVWLVPTTSRSITSSCCRSFAPWVHSVGRAPLARCGTR